MSLLVEYDALTGLGDLMESYKRETPIAARIALNDVASKEGLAVYRKAILADVEFPDGYLTPDRLGVTSKATTDNLAVTITGRQRATSLARFAEPGQNPENTKGKGVRIKVGARGGVSELRQGFLVRLRSGSSGNDNLNLGLAVRLKPGERLRNKREQRAVRLDDNVYLLYGPSVDQVFRDVAVTDTPPVLDKIATEFFRQFFRLTGKKRG